METGSALFRWFYAIALAAMLSACASAPEPISEIDSFSTQAATETFSVGYSNIYQKFLTPVALSDLAIEGMRGLGALDPSLTVQREGDAVILTSANSEVARFPVPKVENPLAWAMLTVNVSRAGRAVSRELRQANNEEIYEAVFDGALSTLDRFSRYAGREEAERNRAKREGFSGIGVRFQVRSTGVFVTEIMEESPAERNGLRAGDLIVRVNGMSTAGKSARQVVNVLRGPAATEVALDIRREGQHSLLSFTIERAHVIPTSVHDRFENGILVLTVSRFNQATTRTLSSKTKVALREHGAALRGIVLDLRGNPGGLLKQAIRSADLFLTQGVILRTLGRHPDSLQFYGAGGADVAQGIPLVILIDGRSASAAEITAAALQDRGRALVIGTTSFGKGSVQTVIRLPNEGEITLTWSRFITPSGYTLHELGVHPTVCTSGTPRNGTDPIDAALSSNADEARLLASWRTIPVGDVARRRDLRASCPAERRPDDNDLALATRLLSEPGLYSRLLGISDTSAAAAQP